jgi:hypothetical protein
VCMERTNNVTCEEEKRFLGRRSKAKSNQLSIKCRWRMGARRNKKGNSEAPPPEMPPWWWVLGFWRGTRRGKSPRSEARKQALEQRLRPFCRRDLAKNKKQQNNMSSAPRHSDKEKGMRDTHCVLHPYLWRNTSHDLWSDDVCGSPTRCVVSVMIHDMMRLGGKRL